MSPVNGSRLKDRIVLALMLIALSTAPVAAHDLRAGELHIGHAWAPPSADMAAGTQVYFALVNRARAPERLIAGWSTVAARIEIPALELAPGRPRALRPGGDAIRLMDLARPLVAGETFVLTLVFERTGTLDLTVIVEDASGH